MAFSPQALIANLPGPDIACVVGFSGGLDSHVLLHALARARSNGELNGSLRAIHVHHGLSPNASAWADHCRQVCTQLEIPLTVQTVQVEKRGHGLEQAAREARLQVFTDELGTGEWLLTAHHLDDQMETMLFRLMRGTGQRGLAGIRSARPFASGMMLRPLLSFTRRELADYAQAHDLQWIEDESNADSSLDRNFLRHQVLPLLESRWPGYRKNWQRFADLAEEGEALQRDLGEIDLAAARDAVHRLSIPALGVLPERRQHNAVRSWFLSLASSHGVPVPDSRVLAEIFNTLIPAAEDAEPRVAWHKAGMTVEARRYAGHLYLVLPQPLPSGRECWQVDSPLDLPAGLGQLALVPGKNGGLVLPDNGEFTVAFRQGGEQVKPAGRKTRSLKKVLQDYRVPPWLRDRIPLVYCGDELVAVADLFLCDGWQVRADEAGGRKLFTIQWLKADLHCGY